MDNNSWRGQGQGQAQIPVGQVMGGESVAAQGMETGDWRNQLQQDSRQRIVNKMYKLQKTTTIFFSFLFPLFFTVFLIIHHRDVVW